MKLAICGKMCSGKSTLAKMICEIDSRYKIYSFGKKVKHVASDLFDMDPLHKDRTLLTSIGTKMRDIDPDVWVNYVIKETQDQTHCIIDDLRYQNEYDALVKHGWICNSICIRPEVQECKCWSVLSIHLKITAKPTTRSLKSLNSSGIPIIFQGWCSDISNSIDYVNDMIRSYIQKNDPSFVKKQSVIKDESC